MASPPPPTTLIFTPPQSPFVAAPPPPFLPPDEEIRRKYDSQQVIIQAVLFITFLIFTTILILGRLRYRGNGTMKFFCTKFFIIAAYLISFIPGLTSGTGESNDLYVFWIAFMAYLAAVANEMSCYTRGDNEDHKKRLVIDFFVVWPLIITALYKSLASPEIIVPIVIIFWVVILKLRERSRALLFATSSSDGLSRATKIISDFNLYTQDPKNEAPQNNFLVGAIEAQRMMGEEPDLGSSSQFKKVITLDTVFKSIDPFLAREDVGMGLKKTCFAYAMFSVLLAKIAGYDDINVKIFTGGHMPPPNKSSIDGTPPPPENSSIDGTPLQPENTSIDGTPLPLNSFDLIEMELEFLYDYLFTNYYAIYSRGVLKKIRDLCVISLFFWLTVPLLIEYHSEYHNILYVILWHGVLDNAFTRFVILAIIIIEFSQVAVFFTSKWAKVLYTCAYLENKKSWGISSSTKLKLLSFFIKTAFYIPRPKLSLFGLAKSTKTKLGQYSILKSHSKIPGLVWFQCWIGSYVDLPRIGQAGEGKIELSENIKGSFIRAINVCVNIHGGIVLSDGIRSLEQVVQTDIIRKYITKETSHARIVLIWHIATSMFEEDAGKQHGENKNNFDTATEISKYCAYLVAFFPHMLPGHVYPTRFVFRDTVRELKKELLEDEYVVEDEDPEELLSYEDSSKILRKGRELHKLLKEFFDKQGSIASANLWKTLADFWIERLLILSLSDHGEAIDAHADSLCVGGQFITHVWALATHAGCSRRAPIPTPISVPPPHSVPPPQFE